MRHQPSGGRYAAGTRIDSHRSRAELELLLARYGASDFVILEHDANATIRFALHGRYVQYVLPLPDPEGPAFAHTPTGRPRALPAQERAYEQAVRQQWRRAVLVMKGKLEAVESGLSPFEREFYGAIQDDDRREKPAPLLLRRRLRWAPETMLVILCLGVLVPAGGAVALGVPAVAVERLAAPAYGDAPDPLGETRKKSSAGDRALRLGAAPSAAGLPVNAGGAAGDGAAPGHALGEMAEANADRSHKANTDLAKPGHGKPGDANPVEQKPDEQKPGKPDKAKPDKGKPDKPDKQKPDKPDKGKGKQESSVSGGTKPPKPPKPPKDEPKKNDGGTQAQAPAPSQGAGKDKDKAQGAAKDKGAGGAANGKK